MQIPRIYQCGTVIRIFKEPLARVFGILENRRTAGSDHLKEITQNQITGSLGYFNNLKRNCDFRERSDEEQAIFLPDFLFFISQSCDNIPYPGI